MGWLSLKFDGKTVATIKERIEKYFDKVEDHIYESLGRVYGGKAIRDRMFDDGVVFDRAGGGLGKAHSASTPSDLHRKLADIYVEGWEDWYKEVQKRHKQIGGSAARRHMERKREERPGDPPHNQSRGTAKPVSYSIWSGMFKEEIADAFDKGGNQYMDVANYLIDSNWRINKEQWPKGYFEKNGVHAHMFSKYTSGIVGGPGTVKEVVPFPNHRIGDITNIMQDAIRQGFTDPTEQILNNMEIEI